MGREILIGPAGTAVLLAYISGFVDTLSFIALFGLFAAHVTGNFVLIATSLMDMHHGLWMKLLAVPVFIAAAVVTRMFIIRRERHRRNAARHVLIVQALLLTAFMGTALASGPLVRGDQPLALLTGLLAAAAMAIQNTAARTFLSNLPPTTVMTGNLMQIIIDAVDLMHGHEPLDAKRARLARLTPMLAAFIAGTLCGAIGYTILGFVSLIVPILAISALAILMKSSPQQVHA
jgi:uncharacterized membrane protein YoaK (UPF0700 family)